VEQVVVPAEAEATEGRERLLVVEAEQRDREDRQVEPGEEDDRDGDREPRLSSGPR
jgi:hypothetical protein